MKKLLTRKEYEEYLATPRGSGCPFCNLEDQIVLGSTTHWVWIACLSPYWRYHTLLIPRLHKTALEELSTEEFIELQKFHKKILAHLLSLRLQHTDGKIADQFIFMIRTRFDEVENGSTYYKPKHLHIHLVPDREGVERFVIDETAVDIAIENIRLP